MHRRSGFVAALAAAVTLAACTTATTTARSAPRPHGKVTVKASPTPAPSPPPPPPRAAVTHVYASDGSRITVAVFHGSVRYVLHNGSEDPGGAAASLVSAGPSVTGNERHLLLAAFNGGFKLSAGDGGYQQEGHVISTLRRGYASLIIYRSGAARIAVWPSGSSGAYSVRQNLPPLVLHGKPTSAAYDWPVWGATLGGGSHVARSALGEDAAGNLIYVGSMSTVPIDLAKALVRFGARTAMELDINPEWVQLDVAAQPGGRLHAAVYEQQRPADQYLTGWSRDFITVLAG